MERIYANPTLPDGYKAKAEALAIKEHRPFANWVGKLIMAAVDSSEGQS